MSAEQFRREMLANASYCAKMGAYFGNGYRRMAIIPFICILFISVSASLTTFPWNLIHSALSMFLLRLVRQAGKDGDASQAMWLGMREQRLNDLARLT